MLVSTASIAEDQSRPRVIHASSSRAVRGPPLSLIGGLNLGGLRDGAISRSMSVTTSLVTDRRLRSACALSRACRSSGKFLMTRVLMAAPRKCRNVEYTKRVSFWFPFACVRSRESRGTFNDAALRKRGAFRGADAQMLVQHGRRVLAQQRRSAIVF